MLERFIGLLSLALLVACLWWLDLPSALSQQGTESHPNGPGTSSTRQQGGESHPTSARPSRATPATVVRLVDGDTLIVRAESGAPGVPAGVETRVRLLEIDTPESVTPGVPLECYGEQAARELTRLAPPGSRVWVLPDRELFDIYGRTLLYLWNDRGRFVNLELVRTGAAEAVLYEPNDRYIDVMDRAEARARRAGAGRWSRCPAV